MAISLIFAIETIKRKVFVYENIKLPSCVAANECMSECEIENMREGESERALTKSFLYREIEI